MSTGQVGTGLYNEYGISGMLWCLPCPVRSSRPYNLYQDHYKGILLVLLLSGIPPTPRNLSSAHSPQYWVLCF